MQVVASLIALLTPLLGSALGSFFSVVVMRQEGLTANKDRFSACDSCGNRLQWFEMIPLLSFIFQRGRCRKCSKALDGRMFLAELLGVLLFGLLAYAFYLKGASTSAFVWLLAHFLLLVLLYYLAVFDLFTFSIPVKVTQLVVGLALSLNIVFWGAIQFFGAGQEVGFGTLSNLFAGALAGGMVWLLVVFTRKQGMGEGDVFIATVIGLMLGWPNIVSAFYITIFSASGIALIYAAKVKRFKGLRVPLVPFLVLGYCGALAFGHELFNLLFFMV